MVDARRSRTARNIHDCGAWSIDGTDGGNRPGTCNWNRCRCAANICKSKRAIPKRSCFSGWATFTKPSIATPKSRPTCWTSCSPGAIWARVSACRWPASPTTPPRDIIARLIAAGYKVAICEQVGAVTKGRGLVERDVTRVLTPGSVLEPSHAPRQPQQLHRRGHDRGRAGRDRRRRHHHRRIRHHRDQRRQSPRKRCWPRAGNSCALVRPKSWPPDGLFDELPLREGRLAAGGGRPLASPTAGAGDRTAPQST